MSKAEARILSSALYAGLWWLIAQAGAASPAGLAPSPLDEAGRHLDGEAPPAPRPGAYHGVVPGPEARNPLPHPRSDPPRLIWTGFKMVGDRSEIFLQTTRPVEHALAPSAKTPGSLSFLLRNCRIHMRNNARKIDTRFFASPVQGVSARQRKRDVELSISLKDGAVPEVRLDPGPDGTQFVVLSFPPGRSAGQPEPAARPETTPRPARAGTPAEVAPPSLNP
jgi:hypothetical protein